MENHNLRKWRQNEEGRWFKKDIVRVNGNEYTNYYMNGTLNKDRETGYYNEITKEIWDDETLGIGELVKW